MYIIPTDENRYIEPSGLRTPSACGPTMTPETISPTMPGIFILANTIGANRMTNIIKENIRIGSVIRIIVLVVFRTSAVKALI
jgi:hypothetical protein